MSLLRNTDPPSLVALLNSGVPVFKADLLTLTLVSGTVVRLTTYDVPVISGSLGTFLPGSPLFKRSMVTHKKGVEVDTMSITLTPRDTDLLGTTPWFKSIRAGALDYAKVRLDVAVFEAATPTVLAGTFNWFTGNVAEIGDLTTMGVELECQSILNRLDIMMPRNLVQPGCLNTLFDQSCGLLETDFRTTGVISGVNGNGSLATNLGQASGYFDGGRLVITSGDNANVVRKIKTNVNGDLFLFAPFVFPITNGTTFRANPGCPKTKDVCNSKFSNLPRFRGMPYVPSPETVL